MNTISCATYLIKETLLSMGVHSYKVSLCTGQEDTGQGQPSQHGRHHSLKIEGFKKSNHIT